MTAAMVDVYVLRQGGAGLEVLLLRRAPGRRSPGSWECVHGHVEGDETPVEAAVREVREETGYEPERLYNLSRVEHFYAHRANRVVVIPAFVAFVGAGSPVLSEEHDRAEWLSVEAARDRVAWPRLRRGIKDAVRLFGGGDAGALADVLRVI
jgi:8-oxo-dGTP pyrophosphatase MutT (NUDIX family)